MGWRERTKSRRNVWANGTWQDGTEDLRNRPFTRHILHPTSASLSHPLPSARSGLPSPPYRFAQRMTWEWGTRWKCYAWNGQSISGSVWSRLCLVAILSQPLTSGVPSLRYLASFLGSLRYALSLGVNLLGHNGNSQDGRMKVLIWFGVATPPHNPTHLISFT